MNRWRLPIVVLLAVVIAGCNACGTMGSATLKAQSGTIDGLKLVGVTYKFVQPSMDSLCGSGAPGMAPTCDKWWYFVEGTAPAAKDLAGKTVRVAMPVLPLSTSGVVPTRKKLADPKDELLCGTPTIADFKAVMDRCGFKVFHHFIVGQYDEKKDIAAALASTIEAITRQMTGFGAAVAPKGN